MKPVYRSAIIVLIGILLGIVLCPHFTSPTVNEKSTVQLHYVMNAAWSSIPFWRQPKKSWEQIGTKLGNVRTSFGGPTSAEASKQIEELESLMRQKVDGIVLFPGEPKALEKTIDKVVATGIPVVTVYVDAPASKRLVFVGGSEEDAGRRVGEEILTRNPSLKSEGTEIIVLYVGPGIDTQEKRLQGLMRSLQTDAPLAKVAQLIPDNIDEAKAAEGVRAAFTRNPNIKAIIGLDSRSAVGAVSALREMGKKPGEVVVTGWDGDADVVKLVESGWVTVTPALHAEFMLQAAFSVLHSYKMGYLYPENGKHTNFIVPDSVQIPLTMITKEVAPSFLSVQE